MKKLLFIYLFSVQFSAVCMSQTGEKKITWFHTFREVTITPKGSPDTILGSKAWMIFDFAFCEKGILLLTYTKNEKNCNLQLLNDSGGIELILKDIKEPLSFYEAAEKSIFIETRTAIFEVSCIGKNVELFPFEKELFYSIVKPMKGINSCAYYLSNWNEHKPEFNYLRMDKKTKKVDTLECIRDQYLYDQYYSEYKFLAFKDRCEIKRLSRETGIDKYDLAAQFTGYTRSFWWKPLYSPLFIQKDTALVFDHYAEQIKKFTCIKEPINNQTFEFHQTKEYKQELIQDYNDESIFALFHKNGKTTLSKINAANGDLEQSYVLFYRYVNKVKVSNGIAYYLYRPFESAQNSFLYAEVLK
jgi:hypothetical protein